MREALLEEVVGPLFPARLVNASPYRPRGSFKQVLNSPVNPMKWDQPSLDMFVSGPDVS